MCLLFPGPLPEDTELTDWSISDPDTEKTQISQELKSYSVLTQDVLQFSFHTWFPACNSATIQASAFLHKEKVASPELQGSKGSKTVVQLLAFCVQPCREP